MIPTLMQLKGREDRHLAAAFVAVCRSVAAGAGDPYLAVDFCQQTKGPEAALRVLKDAIAGHLIADGGLAEFSTMAGAWLALRENAGVFDALKADMLAGQMHSRFAVALSRGTASTTAEGAAKPVTALRFESATLTERKATGLVVISKEMLAFGGGQDLFARLLSTAVMSQTDSVFIAALVTAATGVAATGLDAAGVRHDLRLALDALVTGTESRLHWVMGSALAKRLSAMPDTAGAGAFPTMSPNGGSLIGLPAHVCDALSDTVLLVDAAALVADEISIEPRATEGGAVEMATDPSQTIGGPVESNLVSLFQTNSVALLVERLFAFEPIRPAAIKLTGAASSWSLEGSPLS